MLRILTLLTAVAAAGCSRDDADSIARPAFPVRLFPKVGRGTVLFDDNLCDASGNASWKVLVESSPAPELIDLAKYLADVHPETRTSARYPKASFVRVFDVPRDEDVECLARFKSTTGRPKGDCPLLTVVTLPVAAAGTSSVTMAEEIMLANRKAGAENRAVWSDDLDGSGAAIAYRPLPKSDQKQPYAAVFPIGDSSLRLIGLQVRPAHKWGEVTDASRLAGARNDAPLEQRIKPVRLGGDVRRCIFLREGSTFSFPPVERRDADRVEFSLALDPLAKRPASAAIEVALVSNVDPPIVLGTQSLALPEGVENGFDTVVFALPPRAAGAAERKKPVRPDLEFRIAVTGDCGVLIAEPLLREAQPTGRKNLLLVSIDTLRKDSLSCYGYSRPTSPFIDELARRGARFETVCAVAPYTLPTHATMLTGLMPPRHGAVHTSDRLVTERVSYLPHLMRAAGYHTAAFTGGGFVSDGFGFDAGFDRFTITDPIKAVDEHIDALGPKERSQRQKQNLDAAAAWVESRGHEPWFLFVHTFAVHEYLPPGQDFALFDTKPTTTPGRVFPNWLLDQTWQKEPASAGDVAHLRDRYDATIHYADRRLHDFLHRLELAGELKDTVIAIVSDHGEEFMEHGGLRHSVTLYEEMLQVPWIFVAPSIAANTVVKDPVSQADLMPTLLELLNIDRPANLDGHSRVPALRGDRSGFIDTPLYAQVASPYSRRTALRRGNWKLIENDASAYSDGVVQVPPIQFFDLKNDPGERSSIEKSEERAFSNVSTALTTIEAYLRARAVGKVESQVDSELAERLRQLGYVR